MFNHEQTEDRDLTKPAADMLGRLGRVFGRLLDALFHVAARDRARTDELLATASYINRLRARLLLLIPRLLAGDLPPPRPRAPRPRKDGEAPRPPGFRLRGPRGWLATSTTLDIRIFAGHIRLTLEHEQFAALIAASPRAQRMLRPFCHATGITLPCVPRLTRKPRPRKPRPPRPTAAQRRAELWYPNIEGKPIDLYGASKKMERRRA